MRKSLNYLLITILLLFGLLTLFLSTSVIFDLFGIRALEGNYVPFVVWANFVSSILYLAAATSLLRSKRWATPLLFIATAILILAFIGLVIYIDHGGVHETKTIAAIIFRSSLTLVFAFSAYFLNKPTKQKIKQ